MPVLLFFALVLVSSCAVATGKEAVLDFKLVPGTAETVSVALDTPPIAGSTCTFDYSSTGATTELWSARISGNPRSGEIECEIGRTGGAETYLLFNTVRFGCFLLSRHLIYVSFDLTFLSSCFSLSCAAVITVQGHAGYKRRA